MFTKYSPTANAKKTWDFAKYSPDVVIVDLGTNDIIGYQRNYYDPEYFGGTLTQEIFDNSLKTQYNAFVTRLKTYYPDAAIVICCGTFNYSPRLRKVLPQRTEYSVMLFLPRRKVTPRIRKTPLTEPNSPNL